MLPDQIETRSYSGLEARLGHGGDWMPTLNDGTGVSLDPTLSDPLFGAGGGGADEPQVVPGNGAAQLFPDIDLAVSDRDGLLTLADQGRLADGLGARPDDWM